MKDGNGPMQPGGPPFTIKAFADRRPNEPAPGLYLHNDDVEPGDFDAIDACLQRAFLMGKSVTYRYGGSPEPEAPETRLWLVTIPGPRSDILTELLTSDRVSALRLVSLALLGRHSLCAPEPLRRELADLIREGAEDPRPVEPVPDWLRKGARVLADLIEKHGGARITEWTWARSDRLGLVPNAFLADYGTVPTNPAIYAVIAAIRKGGPQATILVGGWQQVADRVIYEHTIKRGGRILVYPNPVGATDPLPTTEAMWCFVESLNPFTADVALAVLAQLCEPSTGDKPKAPMLQPVRITADTILQYKGINRRGKDRRLLRERIHDEMDLLQSLYFDVDKYPGTDPRTGKRDPKGAEWRGDRLFDIVRVEQYQENLFGERDVIEVSWSVRAGQWAYWWLNPQGRVWVCRMARVILELDHRQNRPAAVMAKNIAQVICLGGPNQRQGLILRRIDRLLEEAGALPRPKSRDRHWAGRTRERFDDAMLKLREVNIFADVTWPDGHGPGAPDRTKGWVEPWLNSKVKIILPDDPPELSLKERKALAPPRPRRGGRQSKPPTPSQRIDGAAIRRARADRGWKQATLARHLGVSTPYLSQLETGKRLPSKALRAKIDTWLEGAGVSA